MNDGLLRSSRTMTIAQSDYLDQIQRGVDFVERHLDSGNRARPRGPSCWPQPVAFPAHLQGRHPRDAEGLHPRAASRGGAEKLRDPERRIIEIALESGYDSQEAFTRAFKQAFELTPHEFRKSGDHRPFVKKAQIDADYLRHLDRSVSRSPEFVELGPLRLVGLATLLLRIGLREERSRERSCLPSGAPSSRALARSRHEYQALATA